MIITLSDFIKMKREKLAGQPLDGLLLGFLSQPWSNPLQPKGQSQRVIIKLPSRMGNLVIRD